MLDILDSVEWVELAKFSAYAAKLPDTIRAFHNAESQDQFDQFFDAFAQLIQPNGHIIVLTEPSARLLIHLLKHTSNPHRIFRYMACLNTLLGSTKVSTKFIPHYRIRRHRPETPLYLRKNIKLYDTIAEAYETYQLFLSHDDPDILIATIGLLSNLPDLTEKFIDDILTCIENTPHAWVQAIGTWTYTKSLPLTRQNRDRLLEKLLCWVESGGSEQFRLSASFGYLSYGPVYNPPVPDVIIENIAHYFSIDFWALSPQITNQRTDWILRSNFSFYGLVNRITRKEYLTWIDIFQRSQLTSLQAHIYYRELLDSAFLRKGIHESLWDNHGHIDTLESNTPTELIYEQRHRREEYQVDKTLMEDQSAILQAIVDCDAFWEIPTNLFSYYYGLPDSRDELRRIIREQAP